MAARRDSIVAKRASLARQVEEAEGLVLSGKRVARLRELLKGEEWLEVQALFDLHPE